MTKNTPSNQNPNSENVKMRGLKLEKSDAKQIEKLTQKKAKLEIKLVHLQEKMKILKKAEQLEKTKENKIDPEIIATFQKLGISLNEQQRLLNFGLENQGKNQEKKPLAQDIILDSVSVRTTFERDLAKLGVIFCPFSKAVVEYPELVQKYLGSVVPFGDNFFACLNSAVFSDGTFVYIPPNVNCPMDLSTYFRINASGTGQFERTLIIADQNSSVSYLEGCTAPERKQNQLHAAVVELVALKGAKIKYSTVQNWYAGDESGQGGVYNLVTKRGICHEKAQISWTQVETGSAITWKYPSVVLKGDDSVGQFYSISITKNHQQADTGSKMIHLGNNSKSSIISKSITQNYGVNTYRGLVKMSPKAQSCYNFTSCDSLILEQNKTSETKEIDSKKYENNQLTAEENLPNLKMQFQKLATKSYNSLSKKISKSETKLTPKLEPRLEPKWEEIEEIIKKLAKINQMKSRK